MIEQSVSLASNGVVKVPGYEQLVRFGYTNNRGVYRLAVTASGEWEGLAIRCFWHVPDGKDPASSLVVDGSVDVPASVTAQPGNGCITFECTDGTKTVTSADLHYRVSANSGTEDGTEPEPGTPAWQQLVDAVHTDATAAEQAKTDAQTAANEAAASAGNADQSAQEAADSLQELKDGIASGDFKGEKGDKGDTGPAVALDTTLTHEGEAADAKATGDAISAVKARQNILVGTETGNPIAVDDAFAAPLCGLTVYGKSTQDGTPTPDAPVPIVSAGDSGSVAVKVTGKNRLPPNLKYNDVTECYVKKNTPITLVFKGNLVSQGGNILFYDEDNNQCWFGIDKGKAVHHVTYTVNLTKFNYLLSDMASENVCLTWNASSPDYEPYREQLLTLPTLNGLPGIPVTSGGNYTDPTGQQWICDEVDLGRGVRVKRIGKRTITSKDIFFKSGLSTNDVNYFSLYNFPVHAGQTGKVNALMSNYFVAGINQGFGAVGKIFLGSISGNVVYFSVDAQKYPDAETFKQWAVENGLMFLYQLTDIIETHLTAEELSAYKALTAYAPDTVVQASDGAGIKLDYQRDVNLVVKNLEDAVASMT